MESLENRLLLFNPVGNDWGAGAALTYSYMADGVEDANGLDGNWTNTALTTMEANGDMPTGFEAEIARGFETWARVTDLTFSLVADGGEDFGDAGPSDIRIGAHMIDGPGAGVGAHAFFPPPNNAFGAGDVHFDVENSFSLGAGGFQLFNFLMHETGHSIGLGHSTGTGASPLMNPSVPNGIQAPGLFGPQLDDVRGVQLIYGAPSYATITLSADDDTAPGDQADDGNADEFRLVRRIETLEDPNGNYSDRDVDVLDIFVNDNYAYSVDWSALDSITINGSSDDDRVILDYSGGEVIPSNGIDFDGMDEVASDDLLIQGGTIASLTYDATGPGAGEITAAGGTLTFQDLEPVTVTSGLGTLTVNVTDNLAHVVDIQNDTTTGPLAGFSEVIIDGGLESIQFTNPTALLAVNTMGGTDTVTLNTMDAAWAANIEIDSGSDSDTVVIAATTAGTITEVTSAVGVPDNILVGISNAADFATGVGDVSGIQGELRVTDAGVGILTVDNSSTAVPQTIALQNRTAQNGTFANYGHTLVNIAPAFIWYDTDRDGGGGISDLRIATGSSNDTIIVDYTGPTGFGYVDVLPSGFLNGFGLTLDAGVTGGIDPVTESNRLVVQARNTDLQSIVYDAQTVNTGELAVVGPNGPPASTIDFSEIGLVRDDTQTGRRTLNNFTAGYHKMVYGEQFTVAAFLDQINLDHSYPATLNGYDLVIDPRVLMDAEPFGFAPWKLFGDYDTGEGPHELTINTSDDGDDNDKVELFPGFTSTVNANTFDGMDTIVVFNTSQQINVDGGPPSAVPGDKLVLPDSGPVDPPVPNGLFVMPAGGELNYQDIEEFVTPDDNESNDTIFTATILGSDMALLEQDQSIHSPFDEDWFKVTAKMTGVLQVNVHHFYADNMDLELSIFDADGDLITEVDTQTDNEFLAIPVVAQKMYFARVRGVRPDGHDGSWNFANYVLEIENTPIVTAPNAVDLVRASDTGMMQDDDYTADNTPTIVIQADLQEVLDPNNDGVDDLVILTPAEVVAGNVPGVAVQLTLTDVGTGVEQTFVATQIGASNLFTVTTTLLADANYAATSAVLVVDGSTPNMSDIGPLSPPLWLTIDTAAPNIIINFDLLDSSDSGMDMDDYVTNVIQPAFDGEVEAGAKVRIFANKVIGGAAQDLELIGQGVAGNTPVVPGRPDNGGFEITVEPLVDGLYNIVVDVEDLAGNVTRFNPSLGNVNLVDLEIDTLAPNLPFLDLLEASDSGRHNDDNVTNDNTPTLSMTTEDRTANPADFAHLIPENLKYRIFDRLEATAEVQIFDSFMTLGDFVSDLQLNFTTNALADGIHNLKLEVEDRAGNISPDFLLDVLIDTVAPAAPQFDLDPAADTGIEGQADLSVDLLTSDTSPTVHGTAEANAIVRLFADEGLPLLTPGVVFQGLTVAAPLDGDDALPDGGWTIDAEVDLNDPAFFNVDGLREFSATAEDLAGNVSPDGFLPVFVDTEGPQVDLIEIGGEPGFDLFAEKPALQGPTPLVNSLVITLVDNPVRVDAGLGGPFVYAAVNEELATNPGNYALVGDATGNVLIQSVNFVDFTVDGDVGMTTVELVFAVPLPDDRFSLTVSDNLRDDAGNALDGESNAGSAGGNLNLPSGDGNLGGNLFARFTIDSRAELGVWAAGSVYVDTNGNFQFDPENTDTTNEDITYRLGFASDNVFAGNFAGPGETADGFDKLAAYGFVAGQFRWLIDTDNDGIPNLVVTDPAQINALPFAGNFDGDATNGDEVGLYNGTNWFLDTNHDFQVDTTLPAGASNIAGFPIAGDFDGDGIDDLGAWTDDTFTLDLSQGDGNVDGTADVSFNFGFIGARERPFATDFDGDGIDDLGLWVPDRAGAVPAALAEWYILVSGGNSIENRLRPNPEPGTSGLIADFRPVPFGNDIFASYGDEFALPVPGNFDPPLVPIDEGQLQVLSYQNPVNPPDVDNDGQVSPRDALYVINDLNNNGNTQHPIFYTQAQHDGPFPDPSGDFQTTPVDALIVINKLNDLADGGQAEGEGSSAAVSPLAIDGLALDARLQPTTEVVQLAVPKSGEVEIVDAPAPASDLLFATLDRVQPEDRRELVLSSTDLEAILDDLFGEDE